MTSTIRIEAVTDGRQTVLSEVSGCEPWRPRIVPTAGHGARVVLVQSRASLLAGDEVRVSVRVAAGAALSVGEIGATIAHNVRGGAPARHTIDIVVEHGGRLAWLGSPLIVAAGSALERVIAITLGQGARALVADAVALGRAYEEPGKLVARTRIVGAAGPLLDETVDTRDPSVLRSRVVAGTARLLGAVTLAGIRDPEPPNGAMQAHSEATVWRGVGGSVPVTRSMDAIARRWSALLPSTAQPGPSALTKGLCGTQCGDEAHPSPGADPTQQSMAESIMPPSLSSSYQGAQDRDPNHI